MTSQAVMFELESALDDGETLYAKVEGEPVEGMAPRRVPPARFVVHRSEEATIVVHRADGSCVRWHGRGSDLAALSTEDRRSFRAGGAPSDHGR